MYYGELLRVSTIRRVRVIQKKVKKTTFQIAAGLLLSIRVRRSPPPTPVCAHSQNGACPGPTDIRSRAPTAAPQGARPSPHTSTCSRPTGSRSRAPTAAPRGDRPKPRTCTCPCPTGSRSRAAPSTPRAVRSSPLPYKGILDATGDLTVPGAPTRLNIQAPRRHPHQSLQTEAPSPPPYHASCGSPLAAGRDRRGRRNIQVSECA